MAQIRGRLVRRLRERNILQQLQLPRRRADERHDRRTVRHHAVRLRDSARGRVLPRPAAVPRRLDEQVQTGKGAVPEPASREAHRASCRGRAPCGGFPCGSAGREHPSRGRQRRCAFGRDETARERPATRGEPAGSARREPAERSERTRPARERRRRTGRSRRNPEAGRRQRGSNSACIAVEPREHDASRWIRNDAARGNKASGEHDAARKPGNDAGIRSARADERSGEQQQALP